MAQRLFHSRARLSFPCSSRNTISAFLALFQFTSLCLADHIGEFSATEKDGEYPIRIIEVFDAPADYVYHVITDYTPAYRINPANTEVEILPSDDESIIWVRNHSKHWVGPFCFHIDWVGDITVLRLWVEQRAQNN